MYRPTLLDGAAEFFDPRSGSRIRVETRQTAMLRQRAPRSVQFSLTNHCNLACWFCSRPTERPSDWTVETALELLANLDRLGVAEVAFGGGEPLVFRGFFELVERLVRETRLAVHFTTNGVLLNDVALERLAGKIGEIRLSLYDSNDWGETIQRLQRHGTRYGVNQLVTPETLKGLPQRLDELEALGCRDILLLPAVGRPALELSSEETRELASLLEKRSGPAVLKLGVCWGPGLSGLPRLFPSVDCGAGREFFEITSDRHVRPCSFHAAALPFETAEDAVGIWVEEKDRLAAAAGCSGCPRKTSRPSVATTPGVRVYNAFASNNSGSYTLLGSFESAEKADEVAAILTQLAVDMADEDSTGNPVLELLKSAGVPAPDDVGMNDDWPAYSGPPEAVAVQEQVWWYSDYTVSMPWQLGHWFYAMGGKVQLELDHSHNPLLAEIHLWPDLPWKERREVDLQPMVDALWLGPLAAEGVEARVRLGRWTGIEVLWLSPEPAGMRALVKVARGLGLQVRLTLAEALRPDPNLDELWGAEDAR